MDFFYKYVVGPHFLHCVPTWNERDLREVAKNRGEGVSPFNDLLVDVIKTAEAERDLCPALALPGDSLRQLVQMFRRQIDNLLFQAVVGTDEAISSSGLSLDRMSLGGTGYPSVLLLSKIQHLSKGRELQPHFNDIVDHASRTYGVDPGLIKAVIKAESDFDPKTTSPKGAMGLMQLMPETARDLGVKNPYDPVENIMGGTRYLKGLLNRYDGDINLALAAYNWGLGNIERNPGRLPEETQTYIARVHKYYQGDADLRANVHYQQKSFLRNRT